VTAIAALALLALTATVSISVQRIVRERDRARAAQATAEARGQELLLAQARLLVESKPTEALAYLKSYAASSQSDWPAVWAVAADARSRIVARHVFRDLASARLSPDGRMVAAVNGANVELIDTVHATSTILGKGWQPTLVTLSASSVAGAAADGEIRRWEFPGGAERTLGTIGEPVDRMVLIDAHTLAAAGASGKLYLFGDAGAPTVLAGHTTSVRFLTYDAASRLLATVGCDDTVRLWSLAEKKERARFDLSAWTVAFSPDSRQLAVAGPGALATLIDLDGCAGTRTSSAACSSRPTARRSSPPASIRPFACGTWPAEAAACSPGTKASSSRWPSRVTAGAWPAPARIRPCACGTCSWAKAWCCAVTTTTCRSSASTTTAGAW
jgi:hypothetical protein